MLTAASDSSEEGDSGFVSHSQKKIKRISFTGDVDTYDSNEKSIETKNAGAGSTLSNNDRLIRTPTVARDSSKNGASGSVSHPRNDGSEEDKQTVFTRDIELCDFNEEAIVFTKATEKAAVSLLQDYSGEDIGFTMCGSNDEPKQTRKSFIPETYPADCYSFMSVHGPSTRFFWFGLMPFVLQILILLFLVLGALNPAYTTSNVDDNPGDGVMAKLLATEVSPFVRGGQILAMICYVIFADASVYDIMTAVHTFPRFDRGTSKDKIWLMAFSCILRLFQAGMATVAAIILVFISNDVVVVILTFPALNFISQLDENCFALAKSGKYGPTFEEEAKYIEDLPLPACMHRKYKHVRYMYTIIPLFITVFSAVIVFMYLQKYNLKWDTDILRVQIDNAELQNYSGCYNRLREKKKWHRYAYKHNDLDASFGFCIDDHEWVLFKGDHYDDPCKANSDKLIHSSETDKFDIYSSFRLSWLTYSGPPADLYFFEVDDPSKLYCEASLDNGICDENFNNADFEYDRGDCCAATCDSPNCNVGGIDAFGSTNAQGDGYKSCKDPAMENLTICFDNIMFSRDPVLMDLSQDDVELLNSNNDGGLAAFRDEKPGADPLLLLYCNNYTKVLKLYVNSDMENECQTVGISDESNCLLSVITDTKPTIHDLPVWYVNYTVYHGERDHRTLIHQGHSNDDASFETIPKCYFKTLLEHINNMTVYNTTHDASSKAINWLMKDKSVDSSCSLEPFITRYALSVLNFAAPISNTFKYQNGLWIQNDLLCRWRNIVCISSSEDSTTVDRFRLDVSELGLSGTIATELGMLSNLHSLAAHSNGLTGPIPSEIGLLSNITQINLSENFLTGSIPSDVGSMTSLADLSLYTNSLTGSIPSEVGLLTNLDTAWLEDNALTGSIPSEVGSMTTLTGLYLSNNDLMGSIPSEIGLLTNLSYLVLSYNSLTGSIPSEIGLLTNLIYLKLSNNDLTGSIPSEIGLLTNLDKAWFEDNKLAGSIPSEVGSMTTLTGLNLSTNSLTGSIPSEIGLLTNLIDLKLSNNDLTGSIPTEFGLLTSLTDLLLDELSLIGSIPTEMEGLDALERLSLGEFSW